MSREFSFGVMFWMGNCQSPAHAGVRDVRAGPPGRGPGWEDPASPRETWMEREVHMLVKPGPLNGGDLLLVPSKTNPKTVPTQKIRPDGDGLRDTLMVRMVRET